MATLDEVQALLESILVRLELMEDRRFSPDMVDVKEGLSDISDNLGLQRAGEIRFGTGTPGKDTGFYGLRISRAPMTYGSTDYFMVGVTGDVLQWGVRTDGSWDAG